MSHSTYTLKFKRKREGLTNYKKRLKLVISGKPRIAVRKTSNCITGQAIIPGTKGDKIVVTVSSLSLKKLGWNYSCKNLPASYLTGLLFAKKALAANIKEGVADIGFHTSVKGGRVYAFLKGVSDGGLEVKISKEVFPSEDRLKGQHIITYSKTAKGSQFNKSKDLAQVQESIQKIKGEISQ